MAPLAIEYIEQRLRDGNALAQTVLQKLSLKKGQVTTCLPRGIAPKSLQDFQTGGKLPTPPASEWSSTASEDKILLMIPVPTTDDWLVRRIREFLLGGGNRVCIFEDSLKRVGDPILGKLTTEYATFDEEIYHLLYGVDASEDRIRTVLKSAKAIPTFIGVLTECEGGFPSKGQFRLSNVQLESLAARAHKVIVGAFDGESYLIWDRGTG